MKALQKIFSANLKTLNKTALLGIVWNYILEETIKKSWEIHTSKMEIFAKIVNYQKSLTVSVKSSSLDVWWGSEDGSDR